MILDAVISEHPSILNSIPQQGNYGGNGANDWWNKIETWNSMYHLYPGIDFATPAGHSPSDLVLGKQLEAQYDQTVAGFGDPDRAIATNVQDNLNETHDQNRGVDVFLGNIGGIINDDLTYGLQSFENFFSDGKAFDIGASIFIGVATVAVDIFQGVAQIFTGSQASQAASAANATVAADAIGSIGAMDTVATDSADFSPASVSDATSSFGVAYSVADFDQQIGDGEWASGISGFTGTDSGPSWISDGCIHQVKQQ